MGSPTFKELLTPADFASCPVWVYDEHEEVYRPVRALDDLRGGGLYDLCIKAVFTTPGGVELFGQVVGVENVFAIGLFAGEEVVLINRNMRARSREQVAKFLAISGLAATLSLDTLFPLRYRSAWGGELFADFEGVFELPA